MAMHRVRLWLPPRGHKRILWRRCASQHELRRRAGRSQTGSIITSRPSGHLTMMTTAQRERSPRRINGPDYHPESRSEQLCGAGDENRTRTVSLGICAVTAPTWPDLRRGVSMSDRQRPLVTGVNGTLMARRTVVRPALMSPCPAPPPSSSIAAIPPDGTAVSRLAKRPRAAWS
jgi:hypothetical protein